jgi:hypothetical protein
MHPYQHEGDVVIIVPPLNTSLDDDQDEGSPKTTESTSEYMITTNFTDLVNQCGPIPEVKFVPPTFLKPRSYFIYIFIY